MAGVITYCDLRTVHYYVNIDHNGVSQNVPEYLIRLRLIKLYDPTIIMKIKALMS